MKHAVGRGLRSDAQRGSNREDFPRQQVHRLPFGRAEAENRQRRPANVAARSESSAEQHRQSTDSRVHYEKSHD